MKNEYKKILENQKVAIYATDDSGKFSYLNPAMEGITGYFQDELYQLIRWKIKSTEKTWSTALIHQADRKGVADEVMQSMKDLTHFECEYRIVRKDGEIIWILEKGVFSRDEKGLLRLDGMIIQIKEKEQSDQINKVLFNISNAVNTTFDLDELYKKIHTSLGYIVDVKNFFIALYDKSKDCITFPYFQDEADQEFTGQIVNVSESASLTAELIRSGKPMFLSEEDQLQHSKRVGAKLHGPASKLWMGVPLIVKNEIIGAMVTQSYQDSHLYGEKDAAILASVSDQVALAIERKRAEEQLRLRELLITSLHKISNAIHTTTNLKQLYVSIHDALKDIIDVRNFSIALYNEEKDILAFQYTADQVDGSILNPILNASKSSSVTYEVIKQGKALLLDDRGLVELAKERGGNVWGILSKSWLGVPLKGKKNNILGAMITQNYDEYNCYKKRDIDLLTSVSEQIAFAIEYKRSETELVAAQKLLVEKAHQAGMADIATGTLHNVGNLLNSVQTSSFVISDTLNSSSFKNFLNANKVLKQHLDNIESFISNDPKGRKLLEYYPILEESFVEERRIINDHLERLNKKIKNISDVIASQQSYAKSSFLCEDYPLWEIAEEALVMMDGLLESNSIIVKKQYQKTPNIKLQKTKLIHILINILKNANDSLMEVDNGDKVIKLSINANKSKVFLKVCDNGVGIPKNRQKKIFSHGFTTKLKGYGFGLHSCANYMTDMRGNMRVESDGVGAGATFILEFPVSK